MTVNKSMDDKFAALACAALCGFLAAPAQAADSAHYSVSTGVDFSSGGYGSEADTDIWFVPVTLKYARGPSTLRLTVPYIRVTAPSGGAIIGYDDEGRPIYSGSGPRSTEQGLGDVVLGYTHSLFERPRDNFLIDVGAKVKFATADEDKGLGSGENDYGVFADVYYLAGAATPFATVGYRFLGDPAGIELRNVWQGTLGMAYQLSDKNSVAAIWDWRQASTPGVDGMNELTASWSHRLDGGIKTQVYAVAGLSDASPDYGLGFMISIAGK